MIDKLKSLIFLIILLSLLFAWPRSGKTQLFGPVGLIRSQSYFYYNLPALTLPFLNYPLPLSLPVLLTPRPAMPFTNLIYRQAAATTTLLTALSTLVPSTALSILSPTALLSSVLFSPLPTTTVVTNTATVPSNTSSYQTVPNNVSANTIQNLNYATTVTVTPILPGLTSLFLPLLL